jgi:hypothetical protein
MIHTIIEVFASFVHTTRVATITNHCLDVYAKKTIAQHWLSPDVTLISRPTMNDII